MKTFAPTLQCGLRLVLLLAALAIARAGDDYWVGGSGQWDDLSH